MKMLTALEYWILFAGTAVCAALVGTGCQRESALQSKVTIVGGQVLQPQDPLYKMTVALSTSVNTSFCSGVLVSNDVVLTAAHCVALEQNQIYVSFGSPAGMQGTISRRVGTIRTHSLYDPEFHSTLSQPSISQLRFKFLQRRIDLC